MDQKFVFQEYIGIRNCPYLKRIFRNKKENKMLGKHINRCAFLNFFPKRMDTLSSATRSHAYVRILVKKNRPEKWFSYV
jgi:hypothetical protein